MPQCKLCEKFATRSSSKGTFCEEHYWEKGADGSSVSERSEKYKSQIRGNYD